MITMMMMMAGSAYQYHNFNFIRAVSSDGHFDTIIFLSLSAHVGRVSCEQSVTGAQTTETFVYFSIHL